jgi:hypothetical protein
MSYRFVDSLDQDGTAFPSWSCSKAVYKLVWHIPLPNVQWINSWWWAQELPETRRVSCRSKFGKLVHLVGFIIKKFVTMHGHMSRCTVTWTQKSYVIFTYFLLISFALDKKDPLKLPSLQKWVYVLYIWSYRQANIWCCKNAIVKFMIQEKFTHNLKSPARVRSPDQSVYSRRFNDMLGIWPWLNPQLLAVFWVFITELAIVLTKACSIDVLGSKLELVLSSVFPGECRGTLYV